MTSIKVFWESLPKPVRVFAYLSVSTILAEALLELGNLENTFLVRVSAQIINLLIVMLESTVVSVREKLK